MKKAMYKALEHLIHMIETAGCNMNLIFNNEKIIYDRINKNMFIFKARGSDNTQLRIVYSFEKKQDNSAVLYILDYANKKHNDKKYLTLFNDKYKNIVLSELFFEEMAVVA